MANPFDDLIPRHGAVQKAPPGAQEQTIAPIPGTLVTDADLGALAPRREPPPLPTPGGFTDPQQYAEIAKGVIPGAIKSAGSVLQAPDVAVAATQSSAASQLQDRLKRLDRLDRGEVIDPREDAVFGYRDFSPEQRVREREKLTRISQQQWAAAPTPVQDRTLFKAGEAVQAFAKTVLPAAPGYEQAFGRQVGEGLGSLGIGIATAPLGALPSVAVLGSMGVGEATQRAVEFDRKERAAGRGGLTQDQITSAGLLGIGPGSTDLLPIQVLLGKLPVRIPEAIRGPLSQAIARIGIQAVIEGVQEGGQGYLQDLIAREVYNPKQVLGENFANEAAVGAGVGGLAEFLRTLGAGAVRSAAGRRGTWQSRSDAPEAQNQPVQPQEPELPWPAAPAQETPPAATPSLPDADPSPAQAKPPVADPQNPFADLVPAAQPAWVAEVADSIVAGKKADAAARRRTKKEQDADPAIKLGDPSVGQTLALPVSPDRPVIDSPSRVVTPDGSMEIEARPEIVELDDLNLASGALQPRDRSRAEYAQGALERASRLDPMQLQPSRVSDTGAPIVMRDGTVLSGNGRTMSIAEVYRNPALAERASAYRASLGPDAASMRQPVMVMRAAEMPAEQAAQFADLSNRGRIAQMSATERAVRDAKSLGLDGVALYQGGDFTAPQNRQFLQDFVQRVVTTAERPSISRNGELTQEGVARMRAAVLASAYGDADVLSRMLESTDDNVRSITGGLLDAAPQMAHLRAGIASGEVAPDMDAVPALMEAVRTFSDLRSRKQPVQQWLAQTDAFGRDPVVEAWVKSFYYDQSNKAKGQQKVALLLNDYATEAMLHRPGGLFADETTISDVMGVARRKNDADQAADLFAPAGVVGESVQEGGSGTAGRADSASRQRSRKGRQPEETVGPEPLYAVQYAPAPIEREYREILRDANRFEASLVKSGASPADIAAAMNDRYGTEVTADQVERGDKWWALAPGEIARSYDVDLPDFAAENILASQPIETESVAMDVNARPAEPQQVRGVEGGASPGPRLTADQRTAVVGMAATGRNAKQIAEALAEQSGQYIRTDLVQSLIEESKASTDAAARKSKGEASRRAAYDSPEFRAASAERMRATMARPEMQVWLKERGQALAAAKGQTVWTPAMVERLGSPEMRSMKSSDAAAALKAEFPNVTDLTENAIRKKRSTLGYTDASVSNVSPFPPNVEKRLADQDIRALQSAPALAKLREEFGAEITARITATSISNKRAGNPNLTYTGKTTNPTGFQWGARDDGRSPDARLAELMTEAANPSERAAILNMEFGGTPLTPKAVAKRWEKIKHATLRAQGEEPMFALGGWSPRDWLNWIKGKTDADSRAVATTGRPQPQGSRESPGQQPGTDRAGRQGNEVSSDSGVAGISGTFRVRGLTGRVLEALPHAQGLRQAYVFLHPEKAWRPDAPLDGPTLKLLQQVPNWTAKAHVTESSPREWVLEGISVRKSKQRDGLGGDLVTAIEQQLGTTLSAPDEMTPAMYGMWRKRELEGSRFRTTSVDNYAQFRGKWYSPERLRDMRDGANEYMQLLETPIERNLAAKKFAELDRIVRGLPAEDLSDAGLPQSRSDDPSQEDSADLMAAVNALLGQSRRSAAMIMLKRGQTYRIPRNVVSDVHAALEPHMPMVPEGYPVGVLDRIEPIQDAKPGEASARAIFTTKDGDEIYLRGRPDQLLGLRAAYVPGRNGAPSSIVFLRFDLGGDLSQSLGGELGHEVTHVIRRNGIIADDAWLQLVRHANDLRLLDGDLRTYLQSIGNESYKTTPAGLTVRSAYEGLYAARADINETMNQEAVAHLVELYHNRQLIPHEVEPVRPILDSILDGSIWRDQQGGDVRAPQGRSDVGGYGANDSLAAVQKADRKRSPQLDMSVDARMSRARDMGFDTTTVWYHGANRSDRIANAGKFDPKRATSGPMAFFTNDPQVASNYATGKQDTSMPDDISIAQYFTVSPKDVGHTRSRTPYTVEQSWVYLTPDQRRDITSKAKRVGYENQDAGDGNIILHPEGVDASISSDQFDYYMRTSARGNPLAALRELWHDSGAIFGEEHLMADIWRLAGYPHKISQENAPWTENPGVLPVYLRMSNPLEAMDYDNLSATVIPALDAALKSDRTRRKEFGTDGWDKNSRYTPKEWVQQLKEDVSNGKVSYVWTSIPDKVTDVLKNLGYDGIIDRGNKGGNPIAGNNTFVPGDDHTVAIPFYANNVRSVVAAFSPDKTNDPNLMAAIQRSKAKDQDALGYVSKLDEVLSSLNPKDRVTAQTLTAKGVKASEIEARGLKLLLDGGAVPVSDLMETAGRNRVEVSEVLRRSEDMEAFDNTARMYYGENFADVSLDKQRQIRQELGDGGALTKWSSYSLDPSNPTYRETVLHLPGAEGAISAFRAANGRPPDLAELDKLKSTEFRSGHFPEPNIIGHMMTSMTRHQGKPVYTVDQIQSDWGQKLRDGGVRDEAKIAGLKRQYEAAQEELDAALEAGKDEPRDKFAQVPWGYDKPLPPSAVPIYERSRMLSAELKTLEASTPGNPLVNTTDQWVNTTLRRALRQAAEADAEYIAIPHGDTVLSYNPGDRDGMVGFYGSRNSEGIVPKNLRKLLEKIDKTIRPEKVEHLETPTDGLVSRNERAMGRNGEDPNQAGFTLFPLTDKVKAEVLDDGQPLFAAQGRVPKTADSMLESYRDEETRLRGMNLKPSELSRRLASYWNKLSQDSTVSYHAVAESALYGDIKVDQDAVDHMLDVSSAPDGSLKSGRKPSARVSALRIDAPSRYDLIDVRDMPNKRFPWGAEHYNFIDESIRGGASDPDQIAREINEKFTGGEPVNAFQVSGAIDRMLRNRVKTAMLMDERGLSDPRSITTSSLRSLTENQDRNRVIRGALSDLVESGETFSSRAKIAAAVSEMTGLEVNSNDVSNVAKDGSSRPKVQGVTSDGYRLNRAAKRDLDAIVDAHDVSQPFTVPIVGSSLRSQGHDISDATLYKSPDVRDAIERVKNKSGRKNARGAASDEVDRRLATDLSAMSAKDAAETLINDGHPGITEGLVEKYRTRLMAEGLIQPKRFKWDSDADAIVIEMTELGATAAAIAEKLGHPLTASSVANRRAALAKHGRSARADGGRIPDLTAIDDALAIIRRAKNG